MLILSVKITVLDFIKYRYCGAQLRNSTFISDDNFMFLTLNTNERVHGRGFLAQARTLRTAKTSGSSRPRHGLLESIWDTAISHTDDRDRSDSSESDSESSSFLDSFWNVLGSMSVSSIL